MAKRPIQIDLRRDLPKVREQLEAILPHIGECRYSAPCAIGAMMSADERQRIVDDGADETSIQFLCLTMPGDQRPDAIELQDAFDSGNVERFSATLARLEAKYLTGEVG